MNRSARRLLMVLSVVVTGAFGPAAALADCSANQELLGLLRWVDHVTAPGKRVDPADVRVLDARYRALMSSRSLARLREAGHMRRGEAVPQLLALTENILARGAVGDAGALGGVLEAVYLQLSDECEEVLGSTLKDWVVNAREMVEDDARAAGNAGNQPVAVPSAKKVAGLALSLAGLIGLIFGIRVLWLWVGGLILRRRGCRIGCDLVIGDYRFQGFITVLARGACRFEFPESTINDFRAALSRTANCTIVIGALEIAGAVQTLRPSSIRIDFHKPLDRGKRATVLARSIGPALLDRKKSQGAGEATQSADDAATGTGPTAGASAAR